MKKALYGLALFLFGCNNSDKTQHSSANTSKENIETYPTKELVIYSDEDEGWGADIKLSIVSFAETDTSKLYTAISVFQGKKLGLLVSIPKKPEGEKGFSSGIALKSIGAESDNLLQTLAKLYKQNVDPSMKFTKSISVAYVNLDEFAKSFGAQNGSDYKRQHQYKLFYEGNGENEYAELYINLSPTDHWVELREKDEEYRPAIIRFLKQ